MKRRQSLVPQTKAKEAAKFSPRKSSVAVEHEFELLSEKVHCCSISKPAPTKARTNESAHVEKTQNHIFKALPLNPKVLFSDRPLGLPKRYDRPTTEPVGFRLMTAQRATSRKPAGSHTRTSSMACCNKTTGGMLLLRSSRPLTIPMSPGKRCETEAKPKEDGDKENMFMAN